MNKQIVQDRDSRKVELELLLKDLRKLYEIFKSLKRNFPTYVEKVLPPKDWSDADSDILPLHYDSTAKNNRFLYFLSSAKISTRNQLAYCAQYHLTSKHQHQIPKLPSPNAIASHSSLNSRKYKFKNCSPHTINTSMPKENCAFSRKKKNVEKRKELYQRNHANMYENQNANR